MKIASIIHSFPNISETFILNQITGLIDLGHQVKIFALYNKSKKIHRDVYIYNLLDNHLFYKIPNNRFCRIIRAFFLFFMYFYKSPFKIMSSLNFFKYGKNSLSLILFYLVGAFLKERFDIVHCHFGPMGIYGAYLKDLGLKGKLVTSFYGYDLSQFIQKHGDSVYNVLFEEGDLFLQLSNNFKDKLIKLGCNKEKIIVHRIGMDMKKFNYNTKNAGVDKKIKLLTIGRLADKKGYKYIIKAIAKVIKKYSNIEYIIAGDGPLRAELETLVDNLGLGKHVIFMGLIKDDEAVKLYEKSHIFILPSITAADGDMEGTPVVLMEAQACGLPVISTYHSGIPEVVEDGKSGFLVQEKDICAIAEKITYLIEHPDIWIEMGKAGREHINKYYNIKVLNKSLVKIYENCLK